jgi:hypothetical protein
MSSEEATVASRAQPWLPSGWGCRGGVFSDGEDASLWQAHAFDWLADVGVDCCGNMRLHQLKIGRDNALSSFPHSCCASSL